MPVEARNLGCLIGLHASYVNGCASLHQKGSVSDWITFFRAEWAQPLYHDRFPQLISLLRTRLRTDDAAKDVNKTTINNNNNMNMMVIICVYGVHVCKYFKIIFYFFQVIII
jgi:hypothetical protein